MRDGERESEAERRHALVAGGGTGGHLFPGLALAAELVSRGWVVSFVGRSGGLEERLARQRHLAFHPLAAAPVVGASALGKLRSLGTTLRSAVAGRRLVRDLGADVVVGTGGYVSVPAVVGARLAGRPILLFEPNADAGVANRWLSRLADEAAVAYEGAATGLRCPTTPTGTPVRPEFFQQPERPVASRRVLVLGGSQGARQLNQMLPVALAMLDAPGRELRVLHQAGEGNVEATREAYRAAAPGLERIEVVPFIDDVAAALGDASVVVSRAGAITLAEVCAVGRPAILVPLALAGAHQADNAAALVAAGAAVMLESAAGAAELASALDLLLEDAERRDRMAAAARGLARADATARLADRLEALVGGAS